MNTSYHSLFGYIAGMLMVLGMYPYVRSIVITKETKLNRASWAIWATLGFINLAAYNSAGEKETIWVVFAACVNPAILFLLSIKYGEKRWYPTDTACLVLAVITIGIWKVTGNPVLALAAGLTTDALGVIPTLLKVKKDPHSENLLGWVMGLLASICNIVAVKEWTWANSMYTVYSVIAFCALVGFIIVGRHLQKTVSK